ncbi:MAG: low molecular weight protein-tyrosine-phosphatase [Solirubrobacterales bacterium]
MIKVLFVCTGNICRSPTAEGVFRAMVEKAGLQAGIHVDSAGTHGYHVGESPDERSCAAAARRGYDLTAQRARRVKAADFDEFDLVLAMDRGHHQALAAMCPPERRDRLHLFMDFAPQFGAKDVPDPYYGGGKGFDLVLDMIEAGSAAILDHIRTRAG